MRFSAMLAEEYILIVPFAYHLQSGQMNHRIPAQQKALAVGCNRNEQTLL